MVLLTFRGETVCRASEFVKTWSGITVFTLTALSADRYMAIVRPVSHHVSDTADRVTVIVAVGIWVFSAILALPAALFSHVPDKFTPTGEKYHICTPFPPYLGDLYPKIHTLVKFIVYYVLPLVLIATFYVLMARHLLVSAQHLPGEAAGQQRQVQARRKVAKMNSSMNYNIYWHSFRIVGFCLSFINSCINPIALYFVSGTFRKYFNRHVFCWCTRRRRGRRRDWDPTDSTATRLSTAPRTEHVHLRMVGGADNGTHDAPHRLTLTSTTSLLSSRNYTNPGSVV
ncbi:neuropeptide CCHamide-1 receptor-like [Penaeus monodon]|uniref:neuropeptide CCHamide-1 receptor-like n=1 Tax=Penaeus monodon TaxID=6687 RepID=UPI0018A7841F|nr:neuropeptide CCHamide-1 receptor-like [Penaeus monodon]